MEEVPSGKIWDGHAVGMALRCFEYGSVECCYVKDKRILW